jgi:ribosomal protein L40E
VEPKPPRNVPSTLQDSESVVLAFELEKTAEYQMRCPNCKKLYSIEGDVMRSSKEPVKFHCAPCDTDFAAVLNNFGGHESVETFELPLVSVGGTRETQFCAKCGAQAPLAASECLACGVLFAKAKTQEEVEEDIFAGRRDLVDSWQQVMSDYEDLDAHDRFVVACFGAGNLAFASHKYGRILSASPTEEIAQAMQARIIALVSYPSERSTIKAQPGLRYLGINNFVLFMGGAVLVAGIMIPAMKSLIVIGLIAILIGMGVHFLIKHP